eukprot:TRINITY_DN60114_c0_g1_i1.p2 TRINITY_DN60114_c0_g1~~TRINITY_DN60114_c0_g1_i1.p2  ORF type:complete len:195 (+),score=110.53 TRINITY_DN60114_c0_g1_i1:84-587(+)
MGRIKKQPKLKRKKQAVVAAAAAAARQALGAAPAAPGGGDVDMGGVDLGTSATPAGQVMRLPPTKGKLLKRQRAEWKQLRTSLTELHKEKRTYSNRDLEEKRERKMLRKKIHELRDEMKERHEQERAAFDGAREEKQAREEVAAVVQPKLSAKQHKQLQSMFAHLTT